MKIIGWNCRGLHKAATVRALLDIQKRRAADVIFLSETHLEEWAAESLKRRLKMDHKEVVESDGRSGGLLLLWKKEVVISLRHKTLNYIDAFVGSGQENMWRLTGMYGEARWRDKHLTWQRLRELRAVCDMPWMVLGDLNEIMYPFEKEGGNVRPERYMQAFRDAVQDCNLTDFGYVGDRYTWQRGNIRERLDRALTNEMWNDKFNNAVLENLEYSRSDHRPLLMHCDTTSEERFGPSVLRWFDARWLKERNFHDVVQAAWGADTQLSDGSLADKLALVHKRLHMWDSSVLKRKRKKLRSTQRELERVTRDAMTEENLARQKELSIEIEKFLEQEELYWAQRGHVDWLKFGDRITEYFTIRPVQEGNEIK